MKSLMIDAGNSSAKWCLLIDDKLTDQQHCSYKDKPAHQCVDDIINQQAKAVDAVFIVSVLGDAFIKQIKGNGLFNKLKLHHVESKKSFAGIQNGYDEPQKLGTDRFVAMIGAKHNYPENKAFIIIDSGTATTIDALDHTGKHLGGLILPGVSLCTESLLKNTQQLPLWGQNQQHNKPELFAKNTSQAIQSASILGLAGAINSVSQAMEKELSSTTKVIKIICGGNAKILKPHLQSSYKVNENLVMLGLKVIAGITYSTPLK